MIKELLDKLKSAVSSAIPEPEPGNGLTTADRKAFKAYFAECDALEPGLGRAIDAYVMSGEGESLLLRLRALPQHDVVLTGHLADQVRIWHETDGLRIDEEASAKNVVTNTARRRVLLNAEGWDPAVFKRLGTVLAELNGPAVRTSNYQSGPVGLYPGTDASPTWFRALLEAIRACRNNNPSDRPVTRELDGAQCLALLALDDVGADSLIDVCFGSETYYGTQSGDAARTTPGLAGALATQIDRTILGLRRLPAYPQSVAIAWLGDHVGLTDPALFDEIVSLLASGGKQVATAALTALRRCDPARVQQRAATMLDSTASRDRLAAVAMLGRIVGRDAEPLLRARAAIETTRAVDQALKEAILAMESGGAAEDARKDDATGYMSADAVWIEIPPYTLPPETPFPTDTDDILRPAAIEADRLARIAYAEFLADRQARLERKERWVQDHFDYPEHYAWPPLRHIAAVASGTAKPGESTGAMRVVLSSSNYRERAAADHFAAAVARVLDRPEIGPYHIIRLAAFEISNDQSSDTPRHRGSPASGWAQLLLGYGNNGAIIRRLRAMIVDGLDARAALAMGAPWSPAAADVAAAMVASSLYGQLDDEREPTLVTALWPLVAENLAALDHRFGLASGDPNNYDMTRALDILGLLPALPRRFLHGVLDLAMGGHTTIAPSARKLLQTTRAAMPVLVGMLTSSDATRRARAAALVARMGGPDQIKPLRQALTAEKSEAVRAALLTALVKLGDDISDQFSEASMLKQAKAGLAKTGAKLLAWFPADALPPVTWADGRKVPPEVVRWWLVLADKVKLPGGDPLMRMTLDRLDRTAAARLGTLVLSAWIAQDTKQIAASDAAAYAEANADALATSMQRWQKDFTREMAYEQIRRGQLGTYLGSANDHRGILALARHVPGSDAVQMVRAFFRDHYRHVAQSKALLECLAANPSGAALQLVLATANRHRTTGVQKLAGELVDRVSQENGWSRDQLADRTVPTGGLDADGVLELPIGDRTFRVLLDTSGDFAVTLQNPAGKVIKALPTLPADAPKEEQEEAAAAKKAFSSLRKELRQTTELQHARLYEAMCSGRAWPPEDFSQYLLGHPVMAPLCRRLVFACLGADDAIIATFRPLSDGTLSGPADEEISIETAAGIRIAHRASLPAETAAAWQTHLADYDVKPLFDQFGRPALDLAALPEATTDIEDRKGWMIETFKLRGAATKLGYVRGPAEDGGVFWTYEKPFVSLGIVARIGFSGAALPETNTPGALLSLGFARHGGNRYGKAIPLRQLPPVLLNETWNDFHTIAAAGTGFDPDYEKKIPW